MRLLLIGSFIATLSSAIQADDDAMIPVGAAVVDITPEYSVRLAGYASRLKESDGITAPIHARAIALGGSSEDANIGQPLAVLVTVDSCGVPAKLTESVFEQLAEELPLDRSRFVISATHTHSAPWLRDFAKLLQANLSDEHHAHLKRYESELKKHLLDVVRRAVNARRPARLSLQFGQVTFARNRRVIQAGQWTGSGVFEDGPVDHRLPTLAAHDVNGRLIAVLCNYACHATANAGATNQIQGDWPGYAADFIEEDHPGTVALIAVGCGADVNPMRSRTEDYSSQHGRAFADEVRRLLTSRDTVTSLGSHVNCHLERITLPFGPLPERSEWEAQANVPGVAGELAREMLAKIDSGDGVPTELIDYPVQTWQFGNDLAMVFLAGEVVLDYAIRMSDMFDADRLWVNAYCNDVPCYIPSKRVLREGGYEAEGSLKYYGRPGRLSPEIEDRICWAVQKQLPHEFYSEELREEFPAPRSPEDALPTMSTRPDLKVELVAAEPLIQDPVAFDWDTSGRLWVVEMGDYPMGPGSGRVQVLEDENNDGRYEKATTFLDDISFPSGICVWRDGVIITAAPDVIYAQDTDGDGRSDKSTVLVTGFAEGNQQHRVNGLRWGLDGWLYLANGDSGGTVQAAGRTGDFPIATQAHDPVSIRFRDIRIHPDTGRVEAVSGQTQFCRERDDFGHWFGNNNSNPIWHYVIDVRDSQRNPHAAVGSPIARIADIPGAAPVYPTSRTVARFNDFHTANRFTSACGTAIYRDTALGEQYLGNAFTCEPVHNLVSRHVLTPSGATFRAARADDEQQSEFLASSDNWFRPTMVRTGPDGALYVCDMYRQVIEHPQWIPVEAQRRLDLQAGNTLGRIYRIVPRDGASRKSDWSSHAWKQIPLQLASQWLESRNGWWRDAGQRIFQHRMHEAPEPWDGNVTSHMSWDHELPEVRIQAVCTAAMDGRLPPQQLLAALSDPDPRVRRRTIPWLEGYDLQTFTAPVLEKLARDDDPGVRFQLACTLGSLSGGDTGELLGALLVRDQENEWIRKAVLTSLNADNVGTVLSKLIDAQSANGSLVAELIEQCRKFGRTADIRQPVVDLLARVADDSAVASDIATAADVINLVRQADELSVSPDVQAAMQQATDASLAVISNSQSDSETLVPAIVLLSSSGRISDQQAERLNEFINPAQPIRVQESALTALLNVGQATRILDGWSSLSPGLRQLTLGSMVSRADYVQLLLDRVADESLSVSDLGAIYREQLLNHRDDTIRNRSISLLGGESSESRTETVQSWITRIESLHGNSTSGQAVFSKRCATCHRLNHVGQQIGASLEALRDRSNAALVTAILDPNKAVETKFLSYTAVTKDGLTISGMMQNETANSVTLIGTDGKPQELLRSEIEELLASNRSFMPEGLEKDLKAQDLIDVIAFVRSTGTPWKQFDGNVPQVIVSNSDGTVTLSAAAAELYGPSLQFEQLHSNLGAWKSSEDFAVWEVEVPQAGWWKVVFDYSCDDAFAGNQLRLATRQRMITASVPGSGGWGKFRNWHAGTIQLFPGRHRITLSSNNVSAELIDVRSIRLIPSNRGQ